MAHYMIGSELSASVQRQCLARFINRYTKEHTPAWVNREVKYLYPVQFASDADWLAHTRFAVTAKGELDSRVRHCESNPTWPDGNVLVNLEAFTNEAKKG